MKKTEEIFCRLKKEYPDSRTALNFSNSWQLLVATILSAQCTDERVNKTTAVLFKDHPELEDYIEMNFEDLAEHIKSCGFYRNKARSILGSAKKIKEDFNGKIPKNIKDLTRLPGVARKTANVVLGGAYGISEGIAVDTHVKRLSFRLGLSKSKNPNVIEKDLMKQLPKECWIKSTYLLIEHGRNICKASRPFCSNCILEDICPADAVTKKR